MTYPEEITSTYDILGQIGEGGGGTIYRAVHKRLQKTVVLKKIKGKTTSILDCRIEVDILKNLKHPYLPNVLDFIESPDGIFTVMEFVPGKSMQTMLDEGYEFDEKEVLKYGKQLCEALEYLHAQNPSIIHGDIKPDNIMVTPMGNICLIDFNISGVLEGGKTQTFGFTPGYSSPEQQKAFEEILCMVKRKKESSGILSEEEDGETVLLDGEEQETVILDGNEEYAKEVRAGQSVSYKSEGEKEFPIAYVVDKRSDIYSVGVTLYVLLAKKLPGTKKERKTAKISRKLYAVLNKAMEQQPEKRYADAGKLLQALQSVNLEKKKEIWITL